MRALNIILSAEAEEEEPELSENIESKTCLVTGGAGFIGSHTCEALLKKGCRVICVDNFNDYYDPRYKRENVREIEMTAQTLGGYFELCEGDIRDTEFLNDVFDRTRPELVVHLAACAGVRPSIENPVLYTSVNLNGTVNILECLKKYDIRRYIFASSSSVYGNNEKVPFAETDRVDNPISPYAATKKAGELICYTYHHLYNINTACLRFFTVYGPRQRPDLAIYKFTKLILEGQTVPFYGDGSTKRDYTYIEDIIGGITKACDWVTSPEKRYGIFNLGESNTISLTHLIETIERELGIKAKLDCQPLQPGDVNITYADISNSQSILGYRPSFDFSDGIKIFADWYRKNRI
jgi:UDP-glucuronate 4-epimerase